MSTYLLEIGTEELPAKFADSVVDQFKSLIEFEFDKNLIEYEDIFCSSTPRRIILLISGLIDLGKDNIELRKGPKAELAFNDGKPTKAAIGFAKSLGINVKDLKIKKVTKGEFVFGEMIEKGKSTRYLISLIIPKLIKSIQGTRFMKWGYGSFKFSRPIRWIISLYNEELLEFCVDNIAPQMSINRDSRGHRLIKNNISINHPNEYINVLKSSGVIVNREIRKKMINELIKDYSEKSTLFPDLSDQLLNEITDLVEMPNLIIGNFDANYLSLPSEVLCTVMKNHQRYIPLFKTDAQISILNFDSHNILSTNFFLISNGLNESKEFIKKGNENVLKARFADAKFFIESDKNLPSSERNKKITSISYLKGLGNLNEKVDRMIHIVTEINNLLNNSNLDINQLIEATRYSKHDLCSEIVNEFPELQGIMGGKYLLNEGFSEDVSLAVAEHYFPRFYKDKLPSSKYGAVLAISDKLETIISIFVVGKRPSGSSDPYALRRNMKGIIQIIWQYDFNLELDKLLLNFLNHWKLKLVNLNFNFDKVLEDLIIFSNQRIISHLEDLYFDRQVINATCESENIKHLNILDIVDVKNRIKLTKEIKSSEISTKLINIISRYSKLANNGNIQKDIFSCSPYVDKQLLEKQSEIDVYKFLKSLENLKYSENFEYRKLIVLFEENINILEALFDNQKGVLIMSDNINIRNNRLNILCLIRNYSLLIADFTVLNF